MTAPLITFLVAAYNQALFVREAVEAALAQTYSPLEVIISDDCSSDATFEVMQKTVRDYRGPHRVVLNRNQQRFSLGGHLNRLVAVSSGELIVCSAGDDVSLPNRTSAICEAWEKSGRRVTSLHSDYIQINKTGAEIEKVFPRGGELYSGEQCPLNIAQFVQTLQPTIFGCTHAFSRRLFQVFGDVPDTLVHEDEVLAFRSILVGGIYYIDQPLVRYRVHDTNVYAAERRRYYRLDQLAREEASVRKFFVNRRMMQDVFVEDLKTARKYGLIQEDDFERAWIEATRLSRRFALILQYLDSRFFARYGKLTKLRNENLEAEDYNFLAKRLVPRPLLLRIRLARNYAARALGC